MPESLKNIPLNFNKIAPFKNLKNNSQNTIPCPAEALEAPSNKPKLPDFTLIELTSH